MNRAVIQTPGVLYINWWTQINRSWCRQGLSSPGLAPKLMEMTMILLRIQPQAWAFRIFPCRARTLCASRGSNMDEEKVYEISALGEGAKRGGGRC